MAGEGSPPTPCFAFNKVRMPNPDVSMTNGAYRRINDNLGRCNRLSFS
jgi:hypothetical protein